MPSRWEAEPEEEEEEPMAKPLLVPDPELAEAIAPRESLLMVVGCLAPALSRTDFLAGSLYLDVVESDSGKAGVLREPETEDSEEEVSSSYISTGVCTGGES
jgi:hypothetical protein